MPRNEKAQAVQCPRGGANPKTLSRCYASRLTVITNVRPVLEIRIPWSVIT